MKAAKSRHNRGGARGSDVFAQKFAKGSPERLLAFRVQTAMRSPKYVPLSGEELAIKFAVSDEEMAAALAVLTVEARARFDESTQTYTK